MAAAAKRRRERGAGGRAPEADQQPAAPVTRMGIAAGYGPSAAANPPPAGGQWQSVAEPDHARSMRVELPDESCVADLARRVAPHLRPGDRIALDGPMGAGKTTFVRHLVAALGGDATCVASPTYTLLHRYESVPPVIHVDACRLSSPGQLAALGFDELCEDAIAAVEWAAQVGAALQPSWRLAFDHAAAGRCAEVAPPTGVAL